MTIELPNLLNLTFSMISLFSLLKTHSEQQFLAISVDQMLSNNNIDLERSNQFNTKFKSITNLTNLLSSFTLLFCTASIITSALCSDSFLNYFFTGLNVLINLGYSLAYQTLKFEKFNVTSDKKTNNNIDYRIA